MFVQACFALLIWSNPWKKTIQDNIQALRFLKSWWLRNSKAAFESRISFVHIALVIQIEIDRRSQGSVVHFHGGPSKQIVEEGHVNLRLNLCWLCNWNRALLCRLHGLNRLYRLCRQRVGCLHWLHGLHRLNRLRVSHRWWQWHASRLWRHRWRCDSVW